MMPISPDVVSCRSIPTTGLSPIHSKRNGMVNSKALQEAKDHYEKYRQLESDKLKIEQQQEILKLAREFPTVVEGSQNATPREKTDDQVPD